MNKKKAKYQYDTSKSYFKHCCQVLHGVWFSDLNITPQPNTYVALLFTCSEVRHMSRARSAVAVLTWYGPEWPSNQGSERALERPLLAVPAAAHPLRRRLSGNIFDCPPGKLASYFRQLGWYPERAPSVGATRRRLV